MDPLVLGIEQHLLGAHAAVELQQNDVAGWLAAELSKLYAMYPKRTGNVTVRKKSDTAIEIERKGGSVRTLALNEQTLWWELVGSVDAKTGAVLSYPGQISPILGNP